MSAQSLDHGLDAAQAAEAVCDLDTTPAPTVRRLMRQLLARRVDVTVEDAVPVVDELISNARQHSRAPRTCRLMLINEGRGLRVEVEDAAPQQPCFRTPDTLVAAGGPTGRRLGCAPSPSVQDRVGGTGAGSPGPARSAPAPRHRRSLIRTGRPGSRCASVLACGADLSPGRSRHVGRFRG